MTGVLGDFDPQDFIIVGSGIAGLRAAIALAPAGRVLILTKADPTESNTGYAQGGIAAAIGADDSPRFTRPTRCAPATACATRRPCESSSTKARATCAS